MKKTVVVVAVALAGAACQDMPMDFDGGPQRSSHPAEDPFYWLPPLGSGAPTGGVFNPDVYPVLRVCRVLVPSADAGAVPCVSGTVLEFTRDATSADLLLSVSTATEQYQANWKTPSVGSDAYFRVAVYRTVSPSSPVLGDPKVLLLKSDGSVTTLEGERVRQSGSTLPLKFRIDKICSDCVETWVGEEPVELVLPGQAALYIPPGSAWSPDHDGEIDFRLVLAPVANTDGPCLPLPHPQYQGCFQLQTFDLDGEEIRIFFGREEDGDELYLRFYPCLSPTAHGIRSQLNVWKWNEKEGSASQLVRLEEVSAMPPQGFSCEGYEDVPEPGTAMWGSFPTRFGLAAATVFRPLARLVGPSAARAQTTLQGYKIRDLSRVGFVRELWAYKTAGDLQVVPPGYELLVDPTIRVVSARRLRDSNVEVGVDGVKVVFSDADGYIFETETANGGYASADGWTAGPVPGASYTLLARAFNPLDTWVNMIDAQWAPFAGVLPGNQLAITPAAMTFTVTVSTYGVTFLTPIGTVSSAPNVTVSPLPWVEICRNPCGPEDAPLFTTQTELKGGSYQANWSAPAGLEPGPHYRIRVRWNNAILAEVPIRAVSGGAKTKEPFTFEIGRNLPIKFVLRLLSGG